MPSRGLARRFRYFAAALVGAFLGDQAGFQIGCLGVGTLPATLGEALWVCGYAGWDMISQARS